MALYSSILRVIHIAFISFICATSLYASSDEGEDLLGVRVSLHTDVESQENVYSSFKRQCMSLSSLENSPLQEGTWNTLPAEVWIKIFDGLSFPTLEAIKLVSKHWYALATDETLSMKTQILRHNFSTLLEKADYRNDIGEMLRKSIAELALNSATQDTFFNSPQSLQKALLSPQVIAWVLNSPSHLPRLLKSTIAVETIAEALDGVPLPEDQHEALITYVKDAPRYQGAFSKDFVTFAQNNAHYHKAFNLLNGFGNAAGKPFETLVRIITSRLGTDEPNETTPFLMAGAAYLDLGSELELLVRQYCSKQAQWSLDDDTQKFWEEFAIIPCSDMESPIRYNLPSHKLSRLKEIEVLRHRATQPNESLAPYELAQIFAKENWWEAVEYYLRLAALRGNINAQFKLGTVLIGQGQLRDNERYFEEAERFIDLAIQNFNNTVCFKRAEAYLQLGYALLGQRKSEEANLAFNIADEEGDDSIKSTIKKLFTSVGEEASEEEMSEEDD